MLAWRGISRSSRKIALPTRWTRSFVRPSQPRLILHQLVTPRPNTLIGKIRYRPDGNPRSKLVGLSIGTLVLANFLTLLTLYDFVDESEMALGLLASIIYVQKVDFSYDTINLSDHSATFLYFKKLYQAFSRLPDEEVEGVFTDLLRMFKHEGEDTQAKAHEIMRHACEQIHEAFEKLDQESIPNTANFVWVVMKEALNDLLNLVQNADVDDGESKWTFQLIKDHTNKDPSKLKDYEVLG